MTPSRATARQMATLRRLATMHGRPEPRLNLTYEEAGDAIRWLSTRRRKGEEHAPIPEPDPEMQPYMTLRNWRTDRPSVRAKTQADKVA